MEGHTGKKRDEYINRNKTEYLCVNKLEEGILP